MQARNVKKQAKPELPISRWSEPRWLRPAIIGLAALFLMGLFSTAIDDSDFWWHLKTGQYVLEHRTLPSPDPFSYTTYAGAPAYPGEDITRQFNLTHEWLAQVLWYAVYAAGGFPGVVLFRALLLAALCGITGLLAARRSGSFYGGLVAALATASVAAWFAADRPALLTFLLTGVFLLVLELRRGVWFLPLLSLVWANLHGGFFLGWIVLGAYVAESLYRRLRGQPEPGERRLWAVALLSVAASFFNPNHWRIFEVLLLYRRSFLTSALVEWKPPGLWRSPYMFDILLYVCAAVLILSWRKVRVSDWLVFAVFLTAALLAFRNVMFFVLLAPVLIVAYFPRKRNWPRFTGFVALALLVVGLCLGIAQGRFFQLRAAEWQYPAGAAQFLKDHRITAPLFNVYEHGGYLIWRLWPRERVFIDGRALNESVYQDYRRILYNIGSDSSVMTGPRMEALARYGIGAIVMDGFSYESGRLYPLAVALMNSTDGEWKLVYEDPQSMVFLRHPPAGMPVLENAKVLENLESECLYHIERIPGECLCAKSLAGLLGRSRDGASRGRWWLGVYLAHPHPPDPETESLYPKLFRQ